jgi:hypothetical protein
MNLSEKAPRTDVLQENVSGVATANADDTFIVAECPYDATVTGVTYTPEANITGAATNNRRVAVVNRGTDGSGTTVVAELTFDSGVNATAGDEKTITLSETAANLDVDAGEVLAYVSDANNTGLADPGGLVQISISRR